VDEKVWKLAVQAVCSGAIQRRKTVSSLCLKKNSNLARVRQPHRIADPGSFFRSFLAAIIWHET
jgi:hypothetical protein